MQIFDRKIAFIMGLVKYKDHAWQVRASHLYVLKVKQPSSFRNCARYEKLQMKPMRWLRAASKPLKTLLLQLCLQQVPGVPSHMALPNCQMAKVWPQYLTEIPLKCFFLLSALYSQSGVWESLPFFTAARNRNYNNNNKKNPNRLSEGWANFENRIKRLEATTCFPLHVGQILDGLGAYTS